MKKIAISFTFVALLCIAHNAWAKDALMVFWYPGEAGSTEEARPVLAAFYEYLNEKDGSLLFDGAYFNTDAGLSYIQSKKPAVGIVSTFAWDTNKVSFPSAKPFLATLPKPYGKTSETYALVGVGNLTDDGQTVYTSEPLTKPFITSKLFADLPASLKLEQTASIMQKIKAIARGELKGYAILTPTEAYTLGVMKSDWATKLSTLATSQPIPTARVILFNPGYKQAEALKKVLLGMQSDPDAQDILSELRLIGFTTP